MKKITSYLSQAAYNVESADVVALSSFVKGEWKSYTFKDYHNISSRLALGLIDSGIGKGDCIVTISGNHPVWNFIDMAAMKIGAVHVALFPNFNFEELTDIIVQTEAKLVFTNLGVLQKQLVANASKIPSVRMVYDFEMEGAEQSSLAALLSNELTSAHIQRLEALSDTVADEDLAAILYTSGTNGKPNGVPFTHKQIAITTVAFSTPVYPLKPGSKVLSFLPLCHAFERYHSYIYLALGASVYYAESIASVSNNIREVQPEHFNAVPALIEGLYKGFLSTRNRLQSVDEQKEFDEAVRHVHSYFSMSSDEYRHHPKTAYFEEKFFAPFKQSLGGSLLHIGSAGAKLNPEILEFMLAINIPVIEWYGITEVPSVSCNNHLTDGKPGTVGKPASTTQIKIAADGEILCKASTLFSGYFKNPELTKLVFDEEGWYHTNDLGELDEDGYLKLIGRKNTIIKLPTGKFINPEEIEKYFLASAIISQIMVYANDRGELSALINLKEDVVQANLPEQAVGDEIARLYNNKVFSDFEKIKSWEVINKSWSIQTGELTPMMKLKRKVILSNTKQ